MANLNSDMSSGSRGLSIAQNFSFEVAEVVPRHAVHQEEGKAEDQHHQFSAHRHHQKHIAYKYAEYGAVFEQRYLVRESGDGRSDSYENEYKGKNSQREAISQYAQCRNIQPDGYPCRVYKSVYLCTCMCFFLSLPITNKGQAPSYYRDQHPQIIGSITDMGVNEKDQQTRGKSDVSPYQAGDACSADQSFACLFEHLFDHLYALLGCKLFFFHFFAIR